MSDQPPIMFTGVDGGSLDDNVHVTFVRLDAIDRRANPKAWLNEKARINRQREARFGCAEIALRHMTSDLTASGLLEFVRADQPDHEIRLRCLTLAATEPFDDQAALLKRAALLLNIVTEADNG